MVRAFGHVLVAVLGEIRQLRPGDRLEELLHRLRGALVRVRASSLNAVDWYGFAGRPYLARAMTGLCGPKSPGLGHDFAGVVEELGAEVPGLAVGDEVFGSKGGALAEYVAAEVVERMPAGLSFEDAATIPGAGFAALQGLRDHGAVQPGQRVLVNGGSGGVGVYAIQIAKALGAEVDAVCSTRNVEQARALGADRVFDYTRGDFSRSGTRYDVLLDVAGTRSWAAMRRAITRDGRVVLIGGARSKRLLGPLGHVARAKLAAKLGRATAVFFIASPSREDLVALRELVETGRVRPVVERRYDLSDAADAMTAMGEGHVRSKLVITI